MRLIDKDGFLELIKDLEMTCQEDLGRFKDEELLNPQRYRDIQRGRIEGIIDCYIDAYSAEEIDAIPVEWIKQQLEKEEYRTFLVDYIEWRSCLDWLLTAWKEENETN